MTDINFDVGNHLTLLGLLYIIFKYFAPLIIVGIVLTVGYFIGRHFYRKYQDKQDSASLVEKFNRPSLGKRIRRWLGL